MLGKSFLDSNILIYCCSKTESEKREKALKISNEPGIIISTQVISELSNVLRKKFDLNWNQILDVIDKINSNFFVHINTFKQLNEAVKLLVFTTILSMIPLSFPRLLTISVTGFILKICSMNNKSNKNSLF